MLPALDPQSIIESNYQDFLVDLGKSPFSGDLEYSYASRLAVSTDNSIYQQLPQAVLFPKSIEDLSLMGKKAAPYQDVTFSARGGGTGTSISGDPLAIVGGVDEGGITSGPNFEFGRRTWIDILPE